MFRTLRALTCFFFFFFNDTATTEIYTLSLHDALPIFLHMGWCRLTRWTDAGLFDDERSEEHTSELQSLRHLVCRLLLEKKKKDQDELVTRLLLLLPHPVVRGPH